MAFDRFDHLSSHLRFAGRACSTSPDADQRWSTWPATTPSERGPRPHPDWLVTAAAALRHRARRRQDRQGGRRLPHRARGARVGRLRPRREALPRRRALRLPSIRAVRGGAARAQLPRRPRDRAQVGARPGGRRRALGGQRVRRTVPGVGCRHPGPVSGAAQRHRAADGVHRRRADRGPPAGADAPARRGARGPVRAGGGDPHRVRAGGVRARRPLGVQPARASTDVSS